MSSVYQVGNAAAIYTGRLDTAGTGGFLFITRFQERSKDQEIWRREVELDLQLAQKRS